MFQPVGPVPGPHGSATAQAMLAAARESQASLKALQKANGHTPAAESGQQAARPVLPVTAPDPADPARLRVPRDPLGKEDIPTGPRPTFEQTPLERLREEAFHAVVPPLRPDASPYGPLPGPEAHELDITT